MQIITTAAFSRLLHWLSYRDKQGVRQRIGVQALLSGCATNPVTGRSEMRLMSEAQEIQQGADAYAANTEALEPEAPVFMEGAVDRRDNDQSKLIVEKVVPMSEAPERFGSMCTTTARNPRK